MAKDSSELSFEIKKDIGAFGDGRWQKHLTLISWGGREPKYDIRAWNESMTIPNKGVTLTKEDLYDLYNLIEEELGLADDSSDDGDFGEEDDEEFE